MAQTIEDLIVKLKAEGFENIDKLRGSFRELSKVTFSTETQIQRTRKELFDFARVAGNTDSVTKGLIDALRGLRAQADFCGASYGQLTTDLRRLNEVQQGATNSLLAQRNALVSTFSETTRVVRVLQDHREALVALQAQTRQNSSAFNTLANDIAAVDGRIQESTQIIGKYRKALTMGLPATEAGARQRLQTLQAGIDLQRETIQLIDEGTAAERRANAARKAEAAAELANLRQQQRQLIFQESARAGRERVRTAAAAFNALELTTGSLAPLAIGGRGGVGEFAMPNTTAALNQELGELRERLNNTILSTENYNNVAVRMAAIQRELRDASAGVAAALYREFARGDIPPAVANLTQLLSALRTSQAALNTRTAEGAEAFRLYEMQARALERQLQQVREQQQGLTAAPIASGFREFSREATTRTAATAAEAEAALARSIARGRRKHGLLSPEEAEQVTTTVNALSRAEIDASNAVRVATDRNAALWLKTQQLKNEQADRLNNELIASNNRVFQAELSQFDTLLAARDRYEVGRQVSKQYLGLGGRDLSSFYEQVVGLGVGTAGTTASKYQGRDFSRVLADTVDAFNLQLTESSRTAVEGMGLFKEAAIAHAGGSAKVREVLDRYEKNAIPENMYPFAGESGKDYERRLVSGGNLFTQAVESFNRALGRAGKTIDISTDSIRDSAIKFAEEAGRAPEVAMRLGKYGASGNIPMYMLPGTKETPETYTTRILGDPKQAIPSLGDVKQSTIRKLQETRDLLEQIRTDIPPIGREAARVSKEVEQNLTKIDRELGRRERGGRRLTAGQAVQAGGAIISGGIFGGPEGFLGGLGGAALGSAIPGLGTVGGAFAGSAIGAQVGMFRQQLVAAGEYAAQIDRLNTALLGVVKTQAAYADAQQTIRLAQAALNIPILEATQGFTQLSASVLAAGGKVSDASTVFRGVTDAIKATGGGADQVQAALLAMTQIFSKGKVSAEELQGQLGERLPGAVALFASATNRSLPQLQKDLQDGAVGLNDVMKFAAELSKTYGRQAAEMASSTADSTARMDASLKDLQYAFGTIVKPITASIQTIIAKLADMATAALRSLGIVKSSISELGAVGRGKDLSQRAGYAFTALGVGEQTYSEKKKAFTLAEQLARAATPQKSIIGVQQNITALQQAREVIRRINADDLDKKQLDLLLRYGSALDKRVEKEQNLLKVLQAKVKATDFSRRGDTADTDKEKRTKDKATKETQAAAVEQQRLANILLDQQLNAADKLFQHQTELDRQRYELQKRLDDLQAQNRALRETGAARDIVNNFQELQQNLRGIEDRRLEAQSAVALAVQLKNTAAIRASFADQGAAALGADGVRKGLPSGIAGYITGDPRSVYYRADHGGTNYHEHLSFVSRQAAEAAYKKLIASGIKVTEFKGYGRVGRHSEGSAHYSGLAFDVPGAQVGIGKERELTARVQSVLGFGSKRLPTGAATQQIRAIQTAGKATGEGLDVAAARQAQKNLEAQVAQERAAVFEQFTLKSTAALREQNETMRDSAELQQLRNRLTLEGVTPNLIDLEENLLRVRQQQTKAETTYSKLIAITKNPEQIAALTTALAEQNAGFAEQIRLFREGTAAKESFDNAMRSRQDTRIGLGLREGAQQYIQSIGTMREATAQLAQTGIKGIEDAIFSLTTTGTANFSEFAASILRDTSRMIIQQLILRSVMQIIGAVGGSGGSTVADPLSNFNAAAATYMPNALGAAYASNGIVPFAMGGIVSRPTFFRYANGGVPGTGLMGEAGPEAIMPLRRLPNGKLGVGATGGGSTNVTVNVDATGSSVQGDSTQGAALGRAIAVAVQAELVNQKRRGGLLSS